VGQQAGGGNGAHLAWPGRVDFVRDDFAHIGRAAGAGQDHALLRVAQAVAEEGGDAALLGVQMRRQFAPQGWLVGDFFGGIEAADVRHSSVVRWNKVVIERFFW
jgi:hypothetical protein